MKELVKKADDLLERIHRLLDRQNELVAELADQRRTIRELNEKLKNQQGQLKDLEQKITLAQLGSLAKEDPKESKMVRQRLNDYLKELDRIIEKLAAEG